LVRGGRARHGWPRDIVRRTDDLAGCVVSPRRWVVDRTFACLGTNRRLAKDYEEYGETTETWVYLAMVRLMLRRLTRQA
jgi:transposase